ncbi:MAG: hypothetical protein EXR81_04985 [Gammaproteobacteria bacterium]|nr:hypothetical protein [Gammaproteobacteria bacterium]
MASLSIRKLDKTAYEQLRIRAAHHAVSMEEEARRIIYQAVAIPDSISGIFRKHFGTKNGVDSLKMHDPHLPHEPMSFDK